MCIDIYIDIYLAIIDLQLATNLYICQEKAKEFFCNVVSKQGSLEFRT